jgi:tripartite ATP-independent transporter DctM subunit
MLLFIMFIAMLAMISAVIGIAATNGTDNLISVGIEMYRGATSFSLIAIPMFVLAGAIMNAGGISRRLISFVSSLIGFVRGGLAMVNVGVSLIFAEISGSAVADVAALGSVMIPEMKRKGYSKEFAAAVTSSSASLAIIIPPSIPMILYAISAGTSIEQLFIAGFIPGVIGGLLLMVVCYVFARKYDFPVEEAFGLANLKKTFIDAIPTLLLPIIILGGIFSGLATATEAAGLAVLAAILVALWYGELEFKLLKSAMLDGAVQTAVVMLLVAASILMGDFLTVARVPQDLAQWIASVSSNQYVILFMLNIFFLILGFFLHSAAAIILVVPIIVPLMNTVGIDPVHFGLVVTLNLAIGQQTPPVASVLITACSIAKSDVWETSKVNIWFVLVLLFVLFLCTYVPAIPMFLVDLFYPNRI